MNHQDGLRIANKLAGEGLDVTLNMFRKLNSRGNTATVTVNIPYQTQPNEIVEIGDLITTTVRCHPHWDGNSYEIED